MDKYIFIHNPKTGGDTITALLKVYKYSCIFVRHPVTKIIYWYNHLELNDRSESYKCLKNASKQT